METVFHVSTLPLDTQLVVEKTVVGAIPTLTIKTVLKEKDVPILEITHGTAEMNSIPSSAQLDGYVTQSRDNVSLESQVKAMLLTQLVPFSAEIQPHQQIRRNINATLPTLHAKHVNQVIQHVLQIEMLLVETVKTQLIPSNVTKLTQKHQNVINAQQTKLQDAPTETLHAIHVFLHKINSHATTKQ